MKLIVLLTILGLVSCSFAKNFYEHYTDRRDAYFANLVADGASILDTRSQAPDNDNCAGSYELPIGEWVTATFENSNDDSFFFEVMDIVPGHTVPGDGVFFTVIGTGKVLKVDLCDPEYSLDYPVKMAVNIFQANSAGCPIRYEDSFNWNLMC